VSIRLPSINIKAFLRLMLEELGVMNLPGDAASAPAMWEFFKVNNAAKRDRLVYPSHGCG
jgi:hypothetical protein